MKKLLLSAFLSIIIGYESFAQEVDLEIIHKNIKSFSQAYMDSDYEALANAYTSDASILPPGPKIISGREAIKKRWVIPEGTKILLHKITPEEIKIIGEYAYDVGYYNGETLRKDGSKIEWQGKYLIVWKKIDNDWKIHLDAWNQVNAPSVQN
ncbi:MAG: DUF4440 domain-containing protein [Cyclobacteriaceae bacterium]